MPSNPTVIHLDLASQKLLLEPDDPLPEFFPRPRAVMVTPIYHDDDAYGQQPLSDNGSESGYRSGRDRGRRYYYADDSDYNPRERQFPNQIPRGGSPSHSYRGGSSDGDYDYNHRGRKPFRGQYSTNSASNGEYGYEHGSDAEDALSDRKRSRVPGTEPPPLPPPDISYYPGGSGTGAISYSEGHPYAHEDGRAPPWPYGQHDSDYGRHDRPHKLRKRRPRHGYASGDGWTDHGEYPPTSDSEDHYSNGWSPDDASRRSFPVGSGGGFLDAGRTGITGRGEYASRSRAEGMEPPQLPPPDISAYPGGGGGHGGGAHKVSSLHQGTRLPPGASGSGSDDQRFAGSQHRLTQSHSGSQHSQPSQYSERFQEHPQQTAHQGRKMGLIQRIFHSGPKHRN